VGKLAKKWELRLPLNQSGSGKLVLSQNYIRKIPLATANASSNASIDYRKKTNAIFQLKLTFPTTYFTGKSYFRYRKMS